MKCLIKISFGVYYIENDKIINGIHSRLSGDVSGLSGDVSGLWGNVSGLWGNVSGLSGNCNLITNQERDNDNNILSYIKE